MPAFSTDKIKHQYFTCRDERRILNLTLNKPKALNALDLDMVRQLQSLLDEARDDASVSMVFIDAEGDKAFCAGGDIVTMYKAMQQSDEKRELQASAPSFLQSFFSEEYQLDYCLHTYPKPVIAWGNGIIMGGGLGVFAAADIRIVTQSARIAMPEISIGLFPDVGGSFFLNKMPEGIGLFLGLTGASVNANDALFTGLAHHLISHATKQECMDALRQLDEVSVSTLHQLFAEFSANNPVATKASKLTELHPHIRQLASAQHIDEALLALKNVSDDAYIEKALASFTKGSAITAKLVSEQLTRSKHLSLADCFRMELNMALTCASLGEFQEGVRALLIDKDNQAKWHFKSVNDVDDDLVQAHFNYFERHGVSKHPLFHLESTYGEYHD